MNKSPKSFLIVLLAFLALGGAVLGLGRIVDISSLLDSSSDTSGTSSSSSEDSSSEETPFNIVEEAQFVFGEVEYDDPGDILDGSYFGLIGEDYPILFESDYESSEVVLDCSVGDDDDSFIRIYSNDCWSTNVVIDTDDLTWETKWSTYPFGTVETSAAESKLSILLVNDSSIHTYRVGIDIASTVSDLDFVLSDEEQNFNLERTFSYQDVTYFEIPPGESYRIDHIPSTESLWLDAIYVYYF